MQDNERALARRALAYGLPRTTVVLMGCARVLLIEPDPAIRSALKEGLEDEGMAFCSAPDVGAAKEWLDRECVPAVVVLDFSYPHYESAEVLQLVRSDPRLRGVPVLATSTLPEHMLPVDADVVLRKPFDLESFLAAVKSLTKRTQPEGGEATLLVARTGER